MLEEEARMWRFTSTIRLLALLSLAACNGVIGTTDVEEQGGPTNDSFGSGSSPGTSSTNTTTIAARVVRLGLDEYANSIIAMFPNAGAVTAGFVSQSDARQAVYTRSDHQVVSELLAQDLSKAADAIASTAVQKIDTLLPCKPATAGEDACAKQFIDAFAPQAYRRPLGDDEKLSIFNLYKGTQSKAGFAAGIEDVISGVLQSAGFLYRTELGAQAANGVAQLEAHEIASELSYLILAGPPDRPLLSLADQNALSDPAAREAEARRLLALPGARSQFVRFVTEWTEMDRLSSSTKDPTVYAGFTDATKSTMLASAQQFVEQVLYGKDSSFRTLMTARLTDPARPGILTQSAFLAALSDKDQSSPVKRGAFVRRHALCEDLPPPPSNLMIVVPAPTSGQTTRERFGLHSASATCSACHSRIDPLGFALEAFDGVGAYRTTDDGKTVDASGQLVTESTNNDGPFTDAASFAERLAGSAQAQACMRRELFRFMSWQNGEGTEARFLAEETTDNMFEALVTFVRSDLFVTRGAK